MTNAARLQWVLLAALIAVSGACGHKPSYSDVDTNKNLRAQNQNSGGQASAPQPAPAEPPAAPSQPVPAPPQPKFQSPSFLDPRGQIKDFPFYPGAQRLNVQIGPVQGVNTASFVLASSDSMDKIAAFFDQAIKKNHWTVVDKVIDPDVSEWTLKKDEGDGLRVQVKKDSQLGRMKISIIRGETMREPGK